jgi:hypothetical protein
MDDAHSIELFDGRFDPLADRGGPVLCSCGWSQLEPETPQQREIAAVFGRIAGLLVAAVVHLQTEMRVAHLPPDRPVNLQHFAEETS